MDHHVEGVVQGQPDRGIAAAKPTRAMKESRRTIARRNRVGFIFTNPEKRSLLEQRFANKKIQEGGLLLELGPLGLDSRHGLQQEGQLRREPKQRRTNISVSFRSTDFCGMGNIL